MTLAVGGTLNTNATRIFSRLKKDGSTGPTALESDGSYFEIMGQ